MRIKDKNFGTIAFSNLQISRKREFPINSKKHSKTFRHKTTSVLSRLTSITVKIRDSTNESELI